MSGDGGRAERLKAALRDNLRRRKAQGRERTAREAEAAPDRPPDGPDAPPPEDRRT